MNRLTNRYPVIHPELTWRLLDGEAVIVSPSSGEIRVLNQIGSELWQLCANNSASVEELERFLENRYGLSEDQAKADVSAFLSDLENRSLIKWETRP
jgi:hypothetical protein